MKRPGKPTGFHYLDHQTCDAKNGLITDVFVTPGNTHDSTPHVVPEEERFRHEDFVPAIIDKVAFNKVQAMVESRKVNTCRTKSGGIIHRYSGMIKCADCGAILVAKWRGSGENRYVEYTCNSHHRYGKQYCTPHRIHESQLDKCVTDELYRLRDRLKEESKKYEKIVREWQKTKPRFEQRIQQYKERIKLLKEQIQGILMERITDKAHADMYDDMIKKREAEIKDLKNRIRDCQRLDEVNSKKSVELKTTAELLDEILSQPKISNADLRMLVEKVLVHQNEDKSLDVQFIFNGAFKQSVTKFDDEQ